MQDAGATAPVDTVGTGTIATVDTVGTGTIATVGTGTTVAIAVDAVTDTAVAIAVDTVKSYKFSYGICHKKMNSRLICCYGFSHVIFVSRFGSSLQV